MLFTPTARVATALGLLALTLTGEVSWIYLGCAWTAWVAGFLYKVNETWQTSIRKNEKWAVAVLVILFLADFFFIKRTLFIAVAHFLLAFQTFKLIGPQQRRDAFQILLLGFFQVLSSCTLSVDVWQAFILVALIPVLSAGLYWNHLAKEMEAASDVSPETWQVPARRMMWILCAIALPVNIFLTAGVFVVFPRLKINSTLGALGRTRTSFTDQVSLSYGGTLEQNPTPILWLEISPASARDRWQGYLRGVTLDYFDGKRWSRHIAGAKGLRPQSGRVELHPREDYSGSALEEKVLLLTTYANTFFISPNAQTLVTSQQPIVQDPDESLHWNGTLQKPLEYEVISYAARRASLAVEKDLTPYLDLPPLDWGKIKTTTQGVSANASIAAQAETLADWLRNRCRYSNALGSKDVPNPVETFLFDTREGPCGHFASALIVLLRLRGIPSRMVSGYWRGEWNEPAQRYLIREKDAHAWVEYFDPAEGWRMIDPSPREPDTPASWRFLQKLHERWVYLGYRWNKTVLEYDLYAQARILTSAQDASSRVNERLRGVYEMIMRDRTSLKASPLSWRQGLYALGFLATGILLWKRYRRQKDLYPAEVLRYRHFLKRMERKGYKKVLSETGKEFAERLAREQPDLARNALDETQHYYSARFNLHFQRSKTNSPS